jgi:hypothetical protein
MEKSGESIAEALQLIRQTAVKDPATGLEPPVPSSDLSELFLVELQSHRERLHRWLRLLSEEAGCDFSSPAPPRKAAHKCRCHRSGPRTTRIGRTPLGRGCRAASKPAPPCRTPDESRKFM